MNFSNGRAEGERGRDDERKFQELVNETVVASIRDLLGESPMQAILYHLHLDGNFTKEPQVFHERLYSLLKQPAFIIEEMIVKALFTRLNLVYASTGGRFDYPMYIDTARRVFLSRKQDQSSWRGRS